MSKDEAVANLANYGVGNVKDGRPVLVTTKNVVRDGVNHFRVLGNIIFENSSVKQITRDWGEGESGPEVDRLWRSFWGR